MARTAGPRSRSIGVAISAIAFAAYLMLTAVPAQAAVTCSYDAVNRQVNIDLSADNDDVTLGVGGGGAILFDDDEDLAGATQCDTATVNNTDGVDVDDTVGDDVAVHLDLSGGPVAPGETPEATGIPEIEFNFNFDDSVSNEDEFFIVGSDGPDNLVAGDGGSNVPGTGAANLNGDNDADVSFDGGLDDLQWDGADGADTISYAGGAGTGDDADGDDAPQFFIDGGDGNDSLTGSDEEGDVLDGQEGNDLLVGGAGFDSLEDDGLLDVDTNGDGDINCEDDDERDVLEGGEDDDSLDDAGDGRDTLRGGNGDDDEFGGDCNDVFDQGSGPNGNDDLDGDGDEGTENQCF